MNTSLKRYLVLCSGIALLGIGFVYTADAQPTNLHNRSYIKPSLIQLEPGDTQQFKAIVTPGHLRTAQLAESVIWSVNDIPGGNQEVGTIDAQGEYRAPATVSGAKEIHICAEVQETENHFCWATVLLGTPSYEKTKSWGEEADKGEHLQEPKAIALNPQGELILTDIGVSKVFRYSVDGEYLGEIGKGPGSGPENYEQPRDIGVDTKGRIFVSDLRTGPPRIKIFKADGTLLHGLGPKGTYPGHILRTEGMAFDSQGRFYTTDIDNMRVSCYDSEGNFLNILEDPSGVPIRWNAPYGLVIDRNDDIFVPGYYGPCQKFTNKGEFLAAFAHAEPPDGPIGFQSATGDRWGNIYLAARREGISPGDFTKEKGKKVCILKYGNNGDFITRIDLPEGEIGNTEMVVDEQDRLYVVFVRPDRVGIDIYIQK